jgi:putative tricarboxylic transport membrane protein
MRFGRDGIAGLIGLAISLVLLPHALGLPKLPIVPVGPGFYPTIVLSFLALTSGALLVQDLLAQRRGPAPSTAAAAPATHPAYGLVAASFAVIAAYIAVLPLLGFRIATALFLVAFQCILEPPSTARRMAMVIAIALGTTIVTYTVFNHYLLVLLPRGSWTDW